MSMFAQATMSSATGGSGGLLQRKCSCGGNVSSSGECEACKKRKMLQRIATQASSAAFAPPIVHDVLQSPGRPLDAATRAYFEPKFGHDFSKVRIHADAKAAHSASAVQAHAYAVGNNIAFGAGQYQPGTRAGRHLLAHELAHTVQQGAGSKGMDRSALAIDHADSSSERQAESAARAVTSGGESAVSAGAVQLSRQPVLTPAANADADSEATMMRNAGVRRTGNILYSLGELSRLIDAVNAGTTTAPSTAAIAATTSKWLNIAPTDPAFLKTVQIARDKLSKSLSPVTSVVKASKGEAECGPNTFAHSTNSAPNLNIHCCDLFFSRNDDCQAVVISHEYFHLTGAHHGGAGAMSAPNHSTLTTAQALDDAFSLAGLAFEAANGREADCEMMQFRN